MPYEFELPKGASKEEWFESAKSYTGKVKAVATKYPPWFLYYYEKVNQYVLISKYSDDGTVWILVTEEYNPNIDFEREVFGINPKDLVTCDLPNHLSYLRPKLH